MVYFFFGKNLLVEKGEVRDEKWNWEVIIFRSKICVFFKVFLLKKGKCFLYGVFLLRVLLNIVV